MKQTKFLLGACLALTLAGCSDEVGITADQLPVSGDEITFGAAAGQFTEPAKRTVYDFVGEENYSNYQQLAIKWVPGQDQVRVYCPNPSEQQWADYTVMAGTTGTGGTASDFYLQRTDENAQGVRWGDNLNAPHEFYSFYPLKTSNGAEISGLQSDTKVRATIPTAQLFGEVTSHTDPNKNRTWYVVEPDMSYAMMVGTGTWAPGNSKNITLNYKPIVTVLDVYVNGPDASDQAGSYTITGVGVRSAKQPIVGTFEYDVKAGTCTYQTPGSGSQDDNWAYVDVAGKDGNGQVLNSGDGMNVKFFLMPQDIQPEELTVYVFLSNGSVLSQPLGTGDGSALVKGEIVKVLTPKVKAAETSNWMSAIGNDVLFASQLSLPGTKHSFTYLSYTDESGSYNEETEMMQTYQTLNINQQFDAGVRAFNVKVNSDGSTAHIYVGGQNTSYTLEDLLDDLADKLDASPTEAVVLTIDFVNASLNRQDWLDDVVGAIDTWSRSGRGSRYPTDDGIESNNSESDYFREITSETTMGIMRHGIGVVILLPASVGDNDKGEVHWSSANVNVVQNYDTSVQNTDTWDATMGSGRGTATISIQNLEQNNNPELNLYPYFITERNVRYKESLNLIETKQGLIRKLMLESWRNNNGGTSADEKVRNLYMNDLSGFCVVNDRDHESTGWVEYKTYTRGGWNLTWNSDFFGTRTATDFRTLNSGNYTYVTYSRDNPSDPSDPSAGDTWLEINTDNSVLGNGGNNALLAEKINPYAEQQIRAFVNDGRTPLGIVFMSFAGTQTVTFDRDYTVNGTTLPALIVANNFKFALATSKNAQQGN